MGVRVNDSLNVSVAAKMFLIEGECSSTSLQLSEGIDDNDTLVALKDGRDIRIGAKYPTVYMAWVSTNDHPKLAKEWGFTAIPATVVYKNGTKVDYFIGTQYLDEQVEGFIKKTL
ncbi:hypothetical protein BDW68DRAFT_181845 [Aspergillus falconensis]